MFERFTAHARRAVVIAQEEAARLDHNYIGTEHLLLGLLRQPEGIATEVLDGFGITLDVARQEVEGLVGKGKKPAGKGHIPFTPRAKKVLELSLREALRLGHNYIGTEHIMLGLIREGDGVAAQILSNHADLKEIRAAVIDRVPAGEPQERDSMGKRAFRDRLQERFGFGPASRIGESEDIAEPALRTSPAVNATLAEAVRLAGPQAMGSHHLLLAALADANSAAALALISLGVDLDQVRERLRETSVAGTSDEQPEEAGRRTMVIRVQQDKLIIELADPVIVAAGQSALDALGSEAATAGEIRGDWGVAAPLAAVWQELRTSLEAIKASVAPPAA